MGIHNALLNFLLPLINEWGYWLLFFTTIAEATPFGIFVPGHIIVLIAGFLVKEGILNLEYTIIIATAGAVIGDSIGYILGRKYGYSLITRYGKYFFLKKKTFDKLNNIVNEHTGKALIIGRFNPATRSFAPFIAGTSDVKVGKFMVFNIIGGTTWAVSSVMIGYIFGQSYEIVSKYIGEIVFAAVAVSIIIILLYKFINKRWHIFTKYYLHVLMVNIASLYIFSKMVEDVVHNQLVTKLDFWISQNITIIWTSLGKSVMIFIGKAFGTTSLLIFGAGVCLIMIYQKRKHNCLLTILSLGGGYVLVSWLKEIVQRTRPENALVGHSKFSFPSGHATMAIIFFSLLIYLFKDDIKNKIIKYVFICSNVFLILLVGFSRIYLNVHWFSDVIAGFALGVFWLTLLILIFKYVTSLRKPLTI